MTAAKATSTSFFLFILAAMPLSSSLAQANPGNAPPATQSVQGPADLHVTVVDPQGAIFPTAHVVLRLEERWFKLEQILDSNGRTTFLSLPPGTYTLSVSAYCFVTKEEKVRMDRQAVNLTVSLQIGGECLPFSGPSSFVPVPVDETTHNPDIIPYPIRPLPKEKQKHHPSPG